MQKITENTVNHIVEWMTSLCDNSGLNGFVVGVSGGIDSAVVSALAARTGKEVLLLDMPIHQPKDQVTRGVNHMTSLVAEYGATMKSVDLTQTFETLKTTLGIDDELSLANTRSRLRMTTLYAYANERKLLVAGTGNKIEDFVIGFYTKYGDGGVDLSPIASYTKTEVYQLGEILGVSEDILGAKPTDGLWEGSITDEDQIGATYAEMEEIMYHLESINGGMITRSRYEMKPEFYEEGLNDRQLEVLKIVIDRYTANQHKMNPIPICPLETELWEA